MSQRSLKIVPLSEVDDPFFVETDKTVARITIPENANTTDNAMQIFICLLIPFIAEVKRFLCK
jgi:hypothetical protein